MSGILLQIGGGDVSVYRETSRDIDSRHLDLDSTGCPHHGVHLDSVNVGHLATSFLRGAENRQHRLILFLLTGAAHGSKEDGSIPLQMYA